MLTKASAHRKDLTTGMADMQHRHFATIATIIRTRLYGDLTKEQRNIVAEAFADALPATNPNFDRRRFLLACGIEA